MLRWRASRVIKKRTPRCSTTRDGESCSPATSGTGAGRARYPSRGRCAIGRSCSGPRRRVAPRRMRTGNPAWAARNPPASVFSTRRGFFHETCSTPCSGCRARSHYAWGRGATRRLSCCLAKTCSFTPPARLASFSQSSRDARFVPRGDAWKVRKPAAATSRRGAGGCGSTITRGRRPPSCRTQSGTSMSLETHGPSATRRRW